MLKKTLKNVVNVLCLGVPLTTMSLQAITINQTPFPLSENTITYTNDDASNNKIGFKVINTDVILGALNMEETSYIEKIEVNRSIFTSISQKVSVWKEEYNTLSFANRLVFEDELMLLTTSTTFCVEGRLGLINSAFDCHGYNIKLFATTIEAEYTVFRNCPNIIIYPPQEGTKLKAIRIEAKQKDDGQLEDIVIHGQLLYTTPTNSLFAAFGTKAVHFNTIFQTQVNDLT